MGLSKDLEYGNSGVLLNYWKILEFSSYRNYNTNEVSINIVLCGYKDKNNRDNGKGYLDTKSKIINNYDIRQLPSETDERDTLYPLIKQQPEWADAIDE